MEGPGVRVRNTSPPREIKVHYPKDPLKAMKLRLAREPAELGFEPVSGGPDGEWLWRGPLCGTQAVIVISLAGNPPATIEVLMPKTFLEKLNWRTWWERLILGEPYGKLGAIFVVGGIRNALLEALIALGEVTGYVCPELRGVM